MVQVKNYVCQGEEQYSSLVSNKEKIDVRSIEDP
jgi:hypothetical protein